MVKKIVIGLSLATLATLSASDSYSQHAVGIKAGTLGLGVEYTTNINDKLDLRVGVNGYNYDTDGTESNVNYDIDLELSSVSAIVDYHPFDNGFILSAGLMVNGNELKYNGQATSGTFEINDVVYNATEVGSLDGKVDFDSVAPYIGMGYNSSTKSAGLHFTADLGVMYQGSPDVTLNAVCGSALTVAQCSVLQTNVAVEKQQLEDEIDDLKIYPVVSVGASYRF